MVRVTSATTTSAAATELVAGKHENRSAAFLLELEPAHLAVRYHGSSRIASRALAAAQPLHVRVLGICPRP
jgi:hypothetical protein